MDNLPIPKTAISLLAITILGGGIEYVRGVPVPVVENPLEYIDPTKK